MAQENNENGNSNQNGQQGNNGNASGGGAPWFESFEPEIKSYVQKKGFTDPKSVVSSYMNLEKLAGGDRKNLIKLPDDMSSGDMLPVWERLGRPKEAKEYTFDVPESLKSLIPEEELNQTKEFFIKNNFTRSQAEGFMKMYFERLSGQVKTQTESYQGRVSEDTKALEKEWGQAYKENQNTINNTLKKLDMTEAEWKTIQNSVGIKRASQLFYQIGKGTKEDNFHGGGGGAGNGNQAPNEAKTEIALLQRDRDFIRRLQSGDADAKKRWNKLHQDANPGEMTI